MLGVFYKKSLYIKLNKSWNNSIGQEFVNFYFNDNSPTSEFYNELNNYEIRPLGTKKISTINKTFGCNSFENPDSIIFLPFTANDTCFININSFMDKHSTKLCKSKAFSSLRFKKKYLATLSSDIIYYETDEAHLYLIFINKNKTELFRVCAPLESNKESTHYEYNVVDEVNNVVDIYETTTRLSYYKFNQIAARYEFSEGYTNTTFIETLKEGDEMPKTYMESLCDPLHRISFPKYHITTNNKKSVIINDKIVFFDYDEYYWGIDERKYDNLENSFIFRNISKYLHYKNINSLYSIDSDNFWKLVNLLDISKGTTESSGEARTLKFKIIVINKLLGYDRFNEKEFKLSSLHFNTIKQDYYFTKDLSLSKILRFQFITDLEKSYIEKIMK